MVSGPVIHIVQSFQWMSRVLQAVDSIHQVGVYCLALVPSNYLPKVCLSHSASTCHPSIQTLVIYVVRVSLMQIICVAFG